MPDTVYFIALMKNYCTHSAYTIVAQDDKIYTENYTILIVISEQIVNFL